jgi:hypothetical protein
VPHPYAFSQGVVIMELVVDARRAALPATQRRRALRPRSRVRITLR